MKQRLAIQIECLAYVTPVRENWSHDIFVISMQAFVVALRNRQLLNRNSCHLSPRLASYKMENRTQTNPEWTAAIMTVMLTEIFQRTLLR